MLFKTLHHRARQGIYVHGLLIDLFGAGCMDVAKGRGGKNMSSKTSYITVFYLVYYFCKELHRQGPSSHNGQ